VGPANVGKSTLSNLVTGRAMSLTADLPGTTRDWVAGLAELPTPIGELAVRWFDTPGLRHSEDPIEQRAIELAARVIESADVLIAVADPASGFSDPATLPRRPDLHVMNKADLVKTRNSKLETRNVLHISALTGMGLDELSAAIADRLGLSATSGGDRPWAFCDRLRRLVESADLPALAGYIGS
jgi:tRNA modification GTPase